MSPPRVRRGGTDCNGCGKIRETSKTMRDWAISRLTCAAPRRRRRSAPSLPGPGVERANFVGKFSSPRRGNGLMKPPRGFLRHLLAAWTWKMAWRDSRTSRKRLLLFSCSIVLGIAALTAIGSLGTNLERAIEEQARTLLGADLALNSREPFSPEMEQLFQKIGGEQSREISFSTMIYFPRGEGTRLVQVRALSGGFPFYGQLETDPPGAAAQFRRGGALVEE